MSETAAGDDLLAAGAGNPEDVSWLSHELSRFGGISASVHRPAATWPADAPRVLIFLREIVAFTPPGPPYWDSAVPT